MHRWSKLFIPTLREAPSDAEVASHKFLLRAGYIRQLGAGIYSYLFLGQRSINRIIAIVREEMNRIGQEFLLPTIHPADLWRESGRWTLMGDNMFRLKDRKGADLCLGMTHEEVITDIARNELRSYKQLPQIWYQIQTKFRDEPRPKAGLLRVRQFIMKDSYSFDLDEAGLDRSYDLHDAAYRAIFTALRPQLRRRRSPLRCHGRLPIAGVHGLHRRRRRPDRQLSILRLRRQHGESHLAASSPVQEMAPTGDGQPELVSTPGQAAIVDVTKFFDIEASSDIKCVAYMATVPAKSADRKSADSKSTLVPAVAFLRGDHFVNETKLMTVLGATDLRPMVAEELEQWMHGPGGYLGPVGLDPAKTLNDGKVNVILDRGLENRHNLVCGANKLDYHYRNVVPGRDFAWTLVADIRNVLPGEGCPNCGKPLKVARAVEVGHIFKLGTRYTDKMGARVLDANGREVTPIMGCYGIGIERILTAAIEQGNDANGFWLPRSIAPFDVVVTVTNIADAALKAAGEAIASDLEAAGFDVLLDDRDERAGVKFKDADLIGIPYRITVGKKAAEGKVELVTRATSSGRDVAIGEVTAELRRASLD